MTSAVTARTTPAATRTRGASRFRKPTPAVSLCEPKRIASIGSAAPSEYARVRNTTRTPTLPVAESDATAANTGPGARHEDEAEARAEDEAVSLRFHAAGG